MTKADTDQNFDVIVVGSGAGAQTCAVVAAHEGLRVLLVEKDSVFGGMSAISGGVAWIPDNPLIRATGIEDDTVEAKLYLRNLIGNHIRNDVIDAFIANGRPMVEFLHANTQVKFQFSGHPDYHTSLAGSRHGGRSLAACEFDGRRLGSKLALLRRPLKELCLLGSMMIDNTDIDHLMHLTRPRSLLHSAGRLAAWLRDLPRYRRGTRLLLGNALMGRLLASAIDAGVTLWRNAAAVELIRQDGRITGAVILQNGRRIKCTASRGVLLSGGGFPHDQLLKTELIPTPEHHYTMAPKTNDGDGIRMGVAVGGHMGEGNWQNFLGTQITFSKDSLGKITSMLPFVRRDRAKPGFVLVNQQGQRFASEALPYNDLARVVDATPGAVPSYLITDHIGIRRYGLGLVRPGPGWARPLGGFERSGYLISAETISALGRKLGIDGASLEATVKRYNGYAASGLDLEFGKGDTYYEQWQGDSAVGPNPSLAPLLKAPFHAVAFWPGDLGTTCGLMTDEKARVLDEQGAPILGLYACGTDMHSIFSGQYPGGGGSIGPAMTFGYIAAVDMKEGSKATV